MIETGTCWAPSTCNREVAAGPSRPKHSSTDAPSCMAWTIARVKASPDSRSFERRSLRRRHTDMNTFEWE
eukprot:3118-Eustigmatos_ZCMA.PRE.1